MTEARENKTRRRKEVPVVEKSKRKMSLREYMLGKHYRREVVASIAIKYGSDFYFKEEWDEIVSKYNI